jgi:predicted ATPase/class 3 adenylate cyclase
MASLPIGTVTFLFTDIEGSTALLQRLGDRRYAEVLAEHQRLLRDAFAKGKGQEVDTQGDAFLVAFSRARDAVATAVAAQQALTQQAWPEGASLRVRMGLHTGEPLAEPSSYVGLDVHRAARICAAGHGSQILLSHAVEVLAARDLPPGVSLRDLGTHRLKDLREPEHLLQVVHPDLPADFPPLKSLDAFPNNLSIQLTSFVGREHEKAEIKRLLTTTRFLTLTGSGGAGKTRLALQVAAEMLEEFSDGVWLVELAALSSPSLVPKAVASALGVPEQAGRALIETLVDALRRKSALVILDNCEHLVAACAQLVDVLLRACPNLRVLATSRETLGATGETTWRVPSLSVPDPQRLLPLDRFNEYEAVRLFIDRAVANDPQFAVTRSNAAAVAQVCHRLDGIPLAIELAAARVKVLAVEQIAVRLNDRFRLLTGGSRTAVPRQQTLRATMDWSFDLLSEEERALLRRLAVFAGGASLEAAEAVCSGNGVDASDILDLLTHLVDKSLVIAETQCGEARFRLLETVRQYGLDKLLTSEELKTMRDRHLDFYLDLAEKAEPQLESAEQALWFNRLEAEHDNLREALVWSMNSAQGKRLRLAGMLGRFWMVRGHFTEGREWLKEVLQRDAGGSAAVHAKTLNWAGWMAIRQHDYTEARQLIEKSLAIYRELEDKPGIADALANLGSLSMNQADHATARNFLRERLAICRQLRDKNRIVDTLADLGHEAWHQGDLAAARRYLKEALALARELGHTRILIFALYSLGLVAFDQHNYAEAHSLYAEGLLTAKELRDMYYGTHLVENFASLIAAEGRYAPAARLLGSADAYRRAAGVPLPFAHRSDYDRPLAAIRGGLNEDAFAAAWAEGRAMTLEQAIEHALADQTG